MADETYQSKYQMNFAKDANCVIINDPVFSGPVTFNAGDIKNVPMANEKIKGIIDGLFAEGTASNGNQWFAIRRVLSDKNIAPKKLADFLSYIDSLQLEHALPFDNENVKKVGQRCTRLAVDVTAWSALKEPSDAEKSQIIVATKMLAQME